MKLTTMKLTTQQEKKVAKRGWRLYHMGYTAEQREKILAKYRDEMKWGFVK